MQRRTASLALSVVGNIESPRPSAFIEAKEVEVEVEMFLIFPFVLLPDGNVDISESPEMLLILTERGCDAIASFIKS